MRRLSRWNVYILLQVLLLCPNHSAGAIGFWQQCLTDVINCATDPTGQDCALNISNATALSVLRTSNGFPISNTSDINSTATALSYHGCNEYCKVRELGGQKFPFYWGVFSQEFPAWLLPYLALLSQLPFGAPRRTDNLMAVILTLGSPTLAAYSLCVTLLNGRWLNDHLLSGIDYPSASVRRSVVHVLSSLQQVPLRIHPRKSGQFESLIVHPTNDQWWTTFSEELDYSHTWSIASATSIGWVVIAYLLAVADSFSNVDEQSASDGQGTVSIWLWLIPIVVGWLVLSPKCDYDRVHKAYNKANRRVFIPDSHDPNANLIPVSFDFGLTISPSSDWEYSNRNIISPDESRIPPVFNYARVLSWSRTVYLTSLYYRAAGRKWNRREGFDGQPIPENISDDVLREHRRGNRDQIMRYCRPDSRKYSSDKVLWLRGALFNMVAASIMSLQLQWATTGAAVLAAWYTPTTGLGCRSLAFLIYGALSTMVWMMLVSSNALGYYAHHLMDDLPTPDLEINKQHPPSSSSRISVPTTLAPSVVDCNAAMPLQVVPAPSVEVSGVAIPDTDTDTDAGHHAADNRSARTISRVADGLRWIGKSLAFVNAIGLIANAIFQYAGTFDNCYCDGSVLYRGDSAFIAIIYSASDISQASSAWIGALALALISCTFFVVTIYLLRDSLLA